MKGLEEKLGYEFKDKSLLMTALTHSSYANENRKRNIKDNERLEFLGDSILGVTVASYLYKNRPDLPEGRMTRLRAELVCEQSLARVAEKLELGKYMRLGKGEEQGGGRKRPSITADAMEAVIAALYLDGGYNRAGSFISRYILEPFEEGQELSDRDNKTELQEIVQRKSGQVLTYELTGEDGPDHNKTFTFSVSLNDKVIGTGSGHNKKEAEQAAAGEALRKMRNDA